MRVLPSRTATSAGGVFQGSRLTQERTSSPKEFGALPGWLAPTLLIRQNACLIGGCRDSQETFSIPHSGLHRTRERCLAGGGRCTAARRRRERGLLRARPPVLSLLLQSLFLRLRLRLRVRRSLLPVRIRVSVSVWGLLLRPHSRAAGPGHTAPGGCLHRR